MKRAIENKPENPLHRLNEKSPVRDPMKKSEDYKKTIPKKPEEILSLKKPGEINKDFLEAHMYEAIKSTERLRKYIVGNSRTLNLIVEYKMINRVNAISKLFDKKPGEFGLSEIQFSVIEAMKLKADFIEAEQTTGAMWKTGERHCSSVEKCFRTLLKFY